MLVCWHTQGDKSHACHGNTSVKRPWGLTLLTVPWTMWHLQSLQLASAPRLSKGKGGRLACRVTRALPLLPTGIWPEAAAEQYLLAQRHLPTSARLTPATTSAGLGSAASKVQHTRGTVNQGTRLVTHFTSQHASMHIRLLHLWSLS